MSTHTPVVGRERKLTAILSADVKGYSRLMGDDEEATIATLTTYREVMTTLIQQHRGRVVDSPGDNLLAEFASAVDAVQSAVAIQHDLKGRNAELPDSRKMEFRIGINVGDVVVEGERLYGDGVNIAARLEGLAEPGGICISGTVYDQIANKLPLSCVYQGEQAVKNIAQPVRVYRILLEPDTAMDNTIVLRQAQHERTPTPVTLSLSKGDRQSRVGATRRAWVAAAGLLLIAATVVAVRYWSSPIPHPQSPIPSAQALPLPDKPSIAVLPFTNMSGDPGQEHISDGMTEAVITDLSKLSGLFVIARNSVFTYKDKAVKINEVGRELGVRYVLEGSVQKAESRVRITTQLVEATTGGHLWAEQYDREWKDIFTLQDEIGEKIVLALKIKLTPEEQARFRRAPTANLEAYEALLRGTEYYWRFTKEANTQARQMLERAIALDPQYAAAYAFLSAIEMMNWLFWDPFRSSLDQILTLAYKAVELEDSLPVAHSVLGYVYVWKKQHAQAIAEAERALVLDPNYANGYFALAIILNLAGRPEEAIGLTEKAMRLDPAYPAQYLLALGQAYHLTGRYEEAIATFKRALARNPNLFDAHASLAISYGELGREAEARAAVAELLKTLPDYSLEVGKLKSPYKDAALGERQLALLHRAGVKRRWPTDNPEALGSYWAGLEHFARRTKEGNAQARQRFEHAIELDTQYAAAYAMLAWTYADDFGWQWNPDPQTLEQAFAVAQRAVALDDSLPMVHQALSVVYLQRKQPEQALAEAERAITLDPNYAEGYAHLGSILNDLDKPAEALEQVQKALRLNPNPPCHYYYVLGGSYARLGRYEETIAAWQQTLLCNPDYLPAHLALADIYWNQWDSLQTQDPQILERALESAQKVVTLSDAHPVAHSLLAKVYLMKKQHAQAIAEAERIIALIPNNADSYALLSAILNYAGQPKKAIERMEQALRLNSQPPAWYFYHLGQAYRLMGRAEKAIATQKKALTQEPHHWGVLWELAVLYSEGGREAEARAAVTALQSNAPHVSLAVLKLGLPYKDPAETERVLVALRKAGLK